jgi:hypothetical protein
MKGWNIFGTGILSNASFAYGKQEKKDSEFENLYNTWQKSQYKVMENDDFTKLLNSFTTVAHMFLIMV